ncbi:hypothetical protein B0G76_2855 [Paraburkholderia sp. BL23I1N1]|uniref:hypothetical protein n=1 Tax=Paraburkholderia sp. BL23I1N1 TaxID=1938802 RepID=UPI000FEF49BF|nr:hypothetical protein [Paraburkholderia sp. BL23I1N1]RKE36653.1 hypothetical protein B0G76_2855 [Paraburkholderia sp. BL23I1N1]
MKDKPAKKMTLKTAERKYEGSPADRKADKAGAEKLMKRANGGKPKGKEKP